MSFFRGDWIEYLPTWITSFLIGLLFYQNIILHHRITEMWKDLKDVQIVVEEGVCN